MDESGREAVSETATALLKKRCITIPSRFQSVFEISTWSGSKMHAAQAGNPHIRKASYSAGFFTV